MKKVLWFSRHDMTNEQLNALGNVEITKISGTFTNVHVPFTGIVNNGEETELPPFKEIVKKYDIVAIVLPIHLEDQVLKIAGDKPVIKALNKRQIIKGENGEEDKAVFVFEGWQRLVEIKIVVEPYIAID